MPSTYKRLGPYVRRLKVKNAGDTCSDLRGVSIEKEFMPSVANVHGTDLSKYKCVEKNQFAFNPMHVGRDEVLPIALLTEDTRVIVSPAYVVFEVKDEEILLPEYLMMWCRRPEFDRNAWFGTDNSVRGSFSWDDFCNMELPMPTIEKQWEIVKEYQVVVDRIQLNERLNAKLEEAAQAIYKRWFVEFEFPMTAEYADSVGKPELAGQPYKSSSGEMVYNEVLEQEIPMGWKLSKLGDITSVVDNRGKTPPHTKEIGEFPLLEISSLKTAGRIPSLGKCSKYISREIYDSWFRNGHPQQKDILFSTVGSLAELKIFWGCRGSVAQNIVGFRSKDGIGLYLYQYLINSINELLSYEIGSVQASIKVSQMTDFLVVVPSLESLYSYEQIVESITNLIFFISTESDILGVIKALLLSKMAAAYC